VGMCQGERGQCNVLVVLRHAVHVGYISDILAFLRCVNIRCSRFGMSGLSTVVADEVICIEPSVWFILLARIEFCGSTSWPCQLRCERTSRRERG
jgi:hypothetical protein